MSNAQKFQMTDAMVEVVSNMSICRSLSNLEFYAARLMEMLVAENSETTVLQVLASVMNTRDIDAYKMFTTAFLGEDSTTIRSWLARKVKIPEPKYLSDCDTDFDFLLMIEPLLINRRK